MRVLLSSTSYPRDDQDWRGRFIADMAQALSSRPELQLDVWAPRGKLPAHSHYAATEAEALWLEQLLQQGGIAQLLRKRGPFALGHAWGLLSRLRAAYRRSPADLLHVNWLQNALPLGVTDKPALITVLGSDFALLRLPGMVAMLRHVLRGRRAILAPNAGWMAENLQHHFGDLAEIRPIPFGIADAWFSLPRNPDTTRPHQWLAVTRITPGKLGALFDWGAHIFGAAHELHLFGPLQDSAIAIPDWVHYHGPTHPAALRDTWFPRASGLITLSRHDEGRPQVVLEAMAAGLPVIASRLPAHTDVITHGVTGMLVDTPAALQQALDWLGDTGNNRAIGTAAQHWVRSHLGTWDDCAERYAAAYRTLLETQP